MKILLTCFEPFDNKKTNTTMEVAKRINLDELWRITLPVSYSRSIIKLEEVCMRYNPDIIISLGEANRSMNVEIEKYAHNILHANIPDNDGVMKINQKINDKAICLSPNYDVYEMVNKLAKEGYNVTMSQSAGSYICNLIMYKTLEMKEEKRIKDAAFIHIPHLEENDLKNLEMIVRCIEHFIIYIVDETSN